MRYKEITLLDNHLTKSYLYATFDQVPSFKGASTHILSSCRDGEKYKIKTTLVSLGEQVLPANQFFKHIPFNIQEKNYLKRAERFQEKLRDFLKVNKFEQGHFRGPFEGRILLEAGLKCIYEVNAVPSFELPYTYGRLPEAVYFKLKKDEQYCLSHSDKIICPSRKIKDFILNRYEGILPNKIEVIENGCDLSDIQPPKYNGGSLNLVYLGTLHPWQGVTWLLKVMRDYPLDIKLDIYASSMKKWSKDVVRLIKKYDLSDKVEIKDSLHKGQIHQALAQYHYGIAPLIRMRRNYVQGCCPVKIKDYLSVGLPVIAPNLEVVTQLITDQESAYIYEVGKINSLGQVLKKLTKEPSMQHILLKNNLQNKDQLFTWQKYNDQLYRLEDQLS